MATSKSTGREYESRREKGYRSDKRPYKPTRYPKGFDRWGQPNICGVFDTDTGNECRDPISEGFGRRCEYHQALHREKLSRTDQPDQREEGL